MTFKLFGYIFGIEKRNNNAVRLPHPPCKIVVTEDGKYLSLHTPEGKLLPYQLSCTIIERINEIPKARIELYVDISELLSKTRGRENHK